MSSVALCAIVRNEAAILPRMLASVKPWIDAWSIVDTGSTDDTKAVIERELDRIPGQLIEEPWQDFAWNRTSAVRHAQKLGCDFLLLLDADHVLDAPEGAEPFLGLSADAYLIELLDHELRYRMMYLVRSDKPWFFVGKTHEFLSCEAPFTTDLHPTLSILHHADGGTRPEKIGRDLALLERSYAEDPKNVRTCFYLAQTYEGAGRREDAIQMYQERIALGGWEEEVYIALLRVARLTDKLDDYFRAHAYRPERPEAILYLAQKLNHLGDRRLALAMCDQWTGVPTKDVLFVETAAEEYGILFEKAVALYWVGQRAESETIFKHLLRLPNLPDHYRQTCEDNLKFFGG